MRAFALLSILLAVQAPLHAAAEAPAAEPAPIALHALDCNLPFAAFDYQPLVVQDFAEMVEKFAERAAAGNHCAQFELGMMYLNGVGVEKSPEQGVTLLRQAADKGHADAQHTLGLMYNHGRNVDRDVTAAMEWYYQAGLSYLRWDNRRLALREIDYISREDPGNAHIQQLRDAIHEHWMASQRMSAN